MASLKFVFVGPASKNAWGDSPPNVAHQGREPVGVKEHLGSHTGMRVNETKAGERMKLGQFGAGSTLRRAQSLIALRSTTGAVICFALSLLCLGEHASAQSREETEDFVRRYLTFGFYVRFLGDKDTTTFTRENVVVRQCDLQYDYGLTFIGGETCFPDGERGRLLPIGTCANNREHHRIDLRRSTRVLGLQTPESVRPASYKEMILIGNDGLLTSSHEGVSERGNEVTLHLENQSADRLFKAISHWARLCSGVDVSKPEPF